MYGDLRLKNVYHKQALLHKKLAFSLDKRTHTHTLYFKPIQFYAFCEYAFQSCYFENFVSLERACVYSSQSNFVCKLSVCWIIFRIRLRPISVYRLTYNAFASVLHHFVSNWNKTERKQNKIQWEMHKSTIFISSSVASAIRTIQFSDFSSTTPPQTHTWNEKCCLPLQQHDPNILQKHQHYGTHNLCII